MLFCSNLALYQKFNSVTDGRTNRHTLLSRSAKTHQKLERPNIRTSVEENAWRFFKTFSGVSTATGADSERSPFREDARAGEAAFLLFFVTLPVDAVGGGVDLVVESGEGDFFFAVDFATAPTATGFPPDGVGAAELLSAGGVAAMGAGGVSVTRSPSARSL